MFNIINIIVFRVELNDGFTYCSYIFIARAAEKLGLIILILIFCFHFEFFIENLALFSIIKPSNDVKSLPNYKNKMILDFDIINDRVRELIGMPIDIQKYNNNNRVNLEGNTSIPFKYLQYEPQTIKEEVKEKEEENNIESKNILNISYKRERDFEPFKFQSNSQKTNLSENKSERIFEPIIQERKYQTPPRKIDYKEKDYFDENIPIFKQEENLIQENIQTSKKNFFEKFKVIFIFFHLNLIKILLI